MDDFNTLEKLEEYIKQANCYGEYNYCFTAQMEDKLGLFLLGSMGGALGGALASKLKSKDAIGYILNKNEKGIGIIPIVEENKKQRVAAERLVFLGNNDIDKVIIKNDGIGFRLIKIVMKDKSKFGFKMAKKIKNIDYHEKNLNKFIECYK